MTVNTKKAERRTLRFDSIDALESDLALIERAHERGDLRHSGNYAPGQCLHHLARWIEKYETGDLPTDLPAHVRLFGRLMRGRILTKGFPAGLPGPSGKQQPETDTPVPEAIATLRDKTNALRSQDLAHKNPMFGAMSHEDVVSLHLRHAELHLSFLHPGDA